MANFRLLPSGNWNAQVRVKGESPQSKTFSTKDEAEAWSKQIEALTFDRKHHTIYTLGMTYCETMLKGKGSYNHALKIVEHLGRHFTQPIHEITPQMINDFKIMRLKKVKPSACTTQERVKQGLENKKAADPEWKPAGKGRNAAKWSEVQALMRKHPTMSADQIAKLADCGVATVYRIKKETKAA